MGDVDAHVLHRSVLQRDDGDLRTRPVVVCAPKIHPVSFRRPPPTHTQTHTTDSPAGSFPQFKSEKFTASVFISENWNKSHPHGLENNTAGVGEAGDGE